MSILDEVSNIEHEAIERIGKADSLDLLRELQVQYPRTQRVSLTAVLKSLGTLSADERKAVGARPIRSASRSNSRLEEATARLVASQASASISIPLYPAPASISAPSISSIRR